MIIIPKRDNKIPRQSNRSKILGSIWSSFNLDLQSDLGLIKVSPRLRINTNGVANQGRANAFQDFDTKIFALCGTKVFKSASHDLISAFTEDTSTGAPTCDDDQSDMRVFNSTLCVTTTTELLSKAENGSGTGAYTSRYTFSDGVAPHKLCYFKKQNRLYAISSSSQIVSVGTASWTFAESGDYFINLALNYATPFCMATDNNYIWIGTINKTQTTDAESTTNECSIVIWDGISSTVTAEYKIRATGILAMCSKDNIIYAIDTSGRLLRFNGGGFEEIDRLPINRELLLQGTLNRNTYFIHPNGFILSKNNTFLCLINNEIEDNGATIKENIPSGVWEWSKETGFVHRQSPTYTTLAASTITDFGQNRVSAVGALCEPNIASTSASGKPTLMCGVTYYTNASSTSDGIFVDDPLGTIQKFGYFVTSWILSSNVKEIWQRIALKYRQLLDSTDKIVIKYRLTEASATEISITWVNTTSFTTSTDVSSYVGYEVEVIQGTGSGLCSHISSVTGSGPYTVTVDETYTGVTTGTAKARLQAWTKFMTINNQNTESTIESLDRVVSERIQIKVCMLFTGEDEVFELVVVNKSHEKYE